MHDNRMQIHDCSGYTDKKWVDNGRDMNGLSSAADILQLLNTGKYIKK